MTETNQTKTSTGRSVIQRLRSAWKRELTLLILRGVSALLAVMAGLVLVDLVADWLLELPGWLRVVLLAANAACIAWAVWIWLRPCMRRFVALHMALRVEEFHRELESVLVSAVQFHEQPPDPGSSVQLMQAVERLAEDKTRSIDFNEVGRVRYVPLMILAALLTLGGLTSVAVGAPGFLPTLMVRLFNPASDAMYPTRTQIEVLTGDRTVLQGAPVELVARTSGENPTDGTVLVNVGDTGWEEIPVQVGDDHRFTAEIDRVSNRMEYYFRLGDARSHVHTISVARPPRIIEATITREFPAYTVAQSDQKADTVRNFNIKVPEGTRLTWNLRTDKPVVQAILAFEDRPEQELSIDESGTRLSIQADAEASLSYRFKLKWDLQGNERIQESPKHFVRVIPDSKPRVAITYPLGDQRATLEKQLNLTFLAADDYGLKQAWIVYQINDSPEQKRPIVDFQGKAQVEETVEWNVAKTLEDLKENDVLTYSIEVQDVRPEGGEASLQRSSSRQITFVSLEDYLAYAMGLRTTYLSQIRQPYQQQREAAKAVRDLIPPAQSPAELEEPQQESSDQEDRNSKES